MTEFLLILFDLIGTVAFAISGALVGVGKKMDLFGTIVLAVSTACGGGVIRDMVVGNIPPNMFRNPLYVSIAAVVAVIVFFLCYWHRKMPKWAGPLYDRMLFWFDTLGLAAFTVDGIMVGISCGYESNAFLLVFLGFLTAAGCIGGPHSGYFPQAHLCRSRHCGRHPAGAHPASGGADGHDPGLLPGHRPAVPGGPLPVEPAENPGLTICGGCDIVKMKRALPISGLLRITFF